jgi:hypothetical protein
LPTSEVLAVKVMMDDLFPSGGMNTDPGFIDIGGPSGDTVVLNVTVPEKMLKELTVIFEVIELPGSTVRLFGFAESPKSAGVFDSLHAVRGCSSQPEKL